MPREKTQTVYTLDELKGLHPDGYATVLKRWERMHDESGECPWAREWMDSLKAVIDACGGELRNWAIGPYGQSWCKVAVNDHYCVEYEDDTEEDYLKDAGWLLREVLEPNGYTDDGGAACFPGRCVWTGFCGDDDFIEAVWENMNGGDTLTEALQDLARVMERKLEEECEYERSEEALLESGWCDREFLEDGGEA